MNGTRKTDHRGRTSDHRRAWIVPVSIALTAASVLVGCSRTPVVNASGTAFDTPAAAAAALYDAAQKNDEPRLVAIFGADGRDLVMSGDSAEDKASRERFVANYQKMHRIGLDAENRTALFIGAENWPLPIPIVEHDGKWSFDTAAGKREVLYRRIGRNETSAIQTCEALVAAEKEYFAAPHDGQAAHQYAKHFASTPGRHDGLFWKENAGDSESPIGPLLAFADSEIAAKEAAKGPVPFNGYYFRMLRGQSQSQEMPGFVAYPAEYRSSGVMTFIVGADGVVHQKDLGGESAKEARALTEVHLDGSWMNAELPTPGS